MAWSASTSSVEQTFSKIEHNHLQRGRAHATHGDTFRRSVVGLTSHEGMTELSDAQLISKARLMYCAGRSWFARSKDDGRRVRFDSGSQQKQRKNTEAEFLRKRKRDVQEVVMKLSSGTFGSNDDVIDVESLDEPMVKEAKRLRMAVEKRKVEAHGDHYLIDCEEPTQKQIQGRLKKDLADDKKRQQTQKTIDQLFSLTSNVKPRSLIGASLSGRVVWIDAPSSTERQILLNHGVHALTTSLREAQIWVVTSNKPEKRALWHAMVLGGVVLSRNALSSQQAGSCILTYKAAIKKPLAFSVTEKFRAKNRELHMLLKSVVEDVPQSQWKFTAARQAHIILCSESEKSTLRKPGKKVYTSEDFFNRSASLTLCTEESGRF